MNFEKIPVAPRKRLLPEGEAGEVTKRKYEKMLMLLRGEFDETSPKERPTVIDFQGLHPDSKEEDYFKWIEREIGIKREILENKNNKFTEESKEVYGKLNDAYEKGRIFLEETLKYSEKDIPAVPKGINSKKDIVDLLKKTVLLNNKISPEGVKSCRLAKAIVIAFETLKNDAELLDESTEKFENKMIAPASKGTPLSLIPTEHKKRFYATTEKGVLVKGSEYARSKNTLSAMLRYANRADFSAKEALKDGIASTIEIETKEQALDLLPILCKWLKEEMGVDRIKIGNQSFLTKEQMGTMQTNLENVISVESFRLKESEANPTSLGKFKTLKITGSLGSSFGEGSPLAKQFEIQIVDPKDENKKGPNHHSVYEVVKLVTARTRLDGGCPEHIFKKFLADASKDSGMSEDTIERYLFQKGKNGKPPAIVKTFRKNAKDMSVGRPLYVAHSVYSRWDDLGWVDNSLITEIDLAKL